MSRSRSCLLGLALMATTLALAGVTFLSPWSPAKTSPTDRKQRSDRSLRGDWAAQEAWVEEETIPLSQKAWALSLVAALLVAFVGPQVELGSSSLGPAAAYARSSGTSGSGSRVNKDPVSLLQYALPLEETCGEDKVKPIRELQANVEEARLFVTQRIFDKARGDVTGALKQIAERKKELLTPVVADRKASVEGLLTQLGTTLDQILEEVGGAEYGGTGTPYQADMVEKCLKSADQAQEIIGQVEEMMLPAGFTSKVPSEYSNLPRLDGRAVVEFTLVRGPEAGTKVYSVDSDLYNEAKFKLTVDGYAAPLSAGNFVDLVQRGFYTGMDIQRADGFIIQTGDPGPEKGGGFQPTPGGPVRQIPLEVGIRGRPETLYGETVDEARLVGKPVKIPFQADGTAAMARREFDNDSASSQVFFFLFESDMTPAGKNLFDGRYGSFGYVTEGAAFLRKIKQGDIIKELKVISGAENLKQST